MTVARRPNVVRCDYTPEQRERILRDASELGVCEAARKHGVPQPTISGWRRGRGSGDNRGGAVNRVTNSSSAAAHTAKGADAPVKQSVTRKQPAKRYTPSQKAQAIELAAAVGGSAAARHLDVSRFALRQWQRELDKAAKGEGPSPTSGPAPSDVEAQRDREILGEWHKHAGLGPSQVRNQLRRRGIKASVATVRRVMEDAGYRPPEVKRDPHDQRYESVRPNHRWHVDFGVPQKAA